eukprot:6184958-Pleurochrysis_carterae.AAC.4
MLCKLKQAQRCQWSYVALSKRFFKCPESVPARAATSSGTVGLKVVSKIRTEPDIADTALCATKVHWYCKCAQKA